MALVFSYKKLLGGGAIQSVRRQRKKAEAALLKAGVPQNTVDAFLDDVESNKQLKTLLGTLDQAVFKSKGNALGVDVLRDAVESGNKLLTVVFAQLVAKQVMVKYKDVFLEVHEKKPKIQLWFHAKRGKTVIVTEI